MKNGLLSTRLEEVAAHVRALELEIDATTARLEGAHKTQARRGEEITCPADLANFLYQARMAAGLPQPFVAAKLGVSQQSVSRYENGKSFPRPEALFQLLRLYGCTLKAGRR